jgi:TrpR-related protein YerC/YecD
MKPHHSSQQSGEDPEHCLFAAITLIRTPDEARKFFLDLCTPAEIQAMADRWRVAAKVKAGIPYRDIYDETGVSVTTVGRVARCLMQGEGGYDLIFERVQKQHGNTTFKNSNTKNRAVKR